jgi:hypothetical protein
MIATEFPTKLTVLTSDSISAYTSVQYSKLVKADGSIVTKYILKDSNPA